MMSDSISKLLRDLRAVDLDRFDNCFPAIVDALDAVERLVDKLPHTVEVVGYIADGSGPRCGCLLCQATRKLDILREVIKREYGD